MGCRVGMIISGFHAVDINKVCSLGYFILKVVVGGVYICFKRSFDEFAD
jgi:hypothetical protein